MQNRNKKIIMFIIVIIFIIILLLTKLSCTSDRGLFYENVYSYLQTNDYGDTDVENGFLKDKDLFEDEFICENIVYEDEVLKMFDCEIMESNDTRIEGYCTYDGTNFECDNTKLDSDDEDSNDIKTEDDSDISNDNDLSVDSKEDNLTSDNNMNVAGNSNQTNENTNNNYNPGNDSGDNSSEEVVPNTQGPVSFDFSKNGITNEDVTVKVNSDDILKYCITSGDTCTPTLDLNGDITLDTEGDNRVCVIEPGAVDAKVVCSDVVTIDKTLPVINNPIITGTVGTNGWYTSDVTIETNGTSNNDDLESITIDKTTIDYNTDGELITITAIDKAGNMAVKTFIIKVDKEAPVITNYDLTGSTGLNNWYISDVTVSGLTATDNLSGVKDIVSNETVFTTETLGTDVIITATDNAGNVTREVVETIKIDKTKPTIHSYDISEVKGLNDWYIESIIISNIDASDDYSGLDSSSLDDIEITVDYETDGEQLEIQVTDLAGHTRTELLDVKVDLNAPVAGDIILEGTKTTSGWYTSDVTVETTAGSDNMSGVKETTVNLDILTGVQAETTVEVTTTDNAGHESTNSEIVKIDKIVPEVGEIIVNGTLGTNGWYTSNVTISKTDGYDSGSGHLATFIDLLAINNNTIGTTVNITTMDTAGLISRDSKIVKIDKSVPTITQNENIKFELGSDINLVDKFTTTFGPSSGSLVCDITDTTSLTLGTHNLSCTATSNAGLTETINTTIEVVDMYEVIEYVESDGGQYINTGVTNTGDYIFEDEFLVTDLSKNTGSWLLGGRLSPHYSLGVHVGPTGVFNGYGGTTRQLSPALKNNVWYEMYFSRFELRIGSYSYSVMGQKLIPEAYETDIYLGGNEIAYDGVSRDHRNFVGMRKSFKITDATTGELIRDFIPVRLNVSGEIGFWDLVEDKFYGNEGTGEFTGA